jgi:hypothetical protein
VPVENVPFQPLKPALIQSEIMYLSDENIRYRNNENIHPKPFTSKRRHDK